MVGSVATEGGNARPSIATIRAGNLWGHLAAIEAGPARRDVTYEIPGPAFLGHVGRQCRPRDRQSSTGPAVQRQG
jgi:hypothetical protein